jgi:hypothetical protein
MNQDERNPAEMMTRDELLAVLSRVGVRRERADEVLRGLQFPVSKRAIDNHLLAYGLTEEALINALGGSPD